MYDHTQIGTLPRVALGAMVLLSAWLTVTSGGAAAVAGMVVFGVLYALFHALRVRISADELRLSFGIGLVHKTYPLRGVEKAEIVTNRWYYGFGIRLTPHGWLYNVSGFQAVEITFTGGKRVRIGTDEPEQLRAALLEAIGSTG